MKPIFVFGIGNLPTTGAKMAYHQGRILRLEICELVFVSSLIGGTIDSRRT
jgi:hypothetical protein